MVRGLNASTGNELWNSGSTVTGGIYAAPSVCGGGSFVSSLWNGQSFYGARAHDNQSGGGDHDCHSSSRCIGGRKVLDRDPRVSERHDGLSGCIERVAE